MATARNSTTIRTRAPAAKKAVVKPVTKPAAPPAKPPAMPTPSAAAPKPAAKVVKTEKPKKPKLVRDSFTIPKAEYTVLDDLKARAAKLARPTKKSELLRAGIKALAAMSDGAFLSALQSVPAIKTGRPTKA